MKNNMLDLRHNNTEALKNLSAFLDKYYASLNESTKKNYILAINEFLTCFNIGLESLKQITIANIRDYINSLLQRLQIPTVVVKLSALKSLFRIVNPKLYESICQDYKGKLKPAIKKHNNDMISSLDITLLKNYLLEKNKIKEYLMFYFMYNHGLRVSEMLGLKYNDIDIASMSIRVIGKRKIERFIILENDILQKINLIKTDNEFLFITKTGKPVSRIYVHYWLNQLANRLIFKPLHPHMLRHAFFTGMINAGVNLVKVSQYGGHRNINTTCSMYFDDALKLNELKLLGV